MKERIIKRVGRIISGSFNSLIGVIENAAPETVMAESIREVDGAIDEVRAELGKAVANKHLATSRLMEENSKYEKLTEKIDLAVKEDRDDLAEAAIAKQFDIEAQIPVLEATINDCAEQGKEMEGYINALLAKKREMQEDLRQYRRSHASADERELSEGVDEHRQSSAVEGRVQKAESAFERVLEKASGIESVAGVTDRKTASQLAELEDLSRNRRIKDRLAAVKGTGGREA